ncbi:hypothetical protein [Lewinella sp. IMCC34191]|uniref:hypothetical protein n=1 Tax=Lewinella sp. IMCC34191 TaxID=2259172 RepID=UPI001300AAEF|nr:hypothetical protein [Lewinella sp. IMCC34191]
MTRTCLTGLLVLLLLPLTAQLANSKKAITEIRRSKIILGLTGDEQIDQALRTAVDTFWRVGRLSGEMPYEEALEVANKDDGTMVLYFDNMTSETSMLQNQFGQSGLTRQTWVPGPSSRSLILTVSSGKRLKRDMKAFLALPTDDDGTVPEAAVHFAVSALNDMCATVARAPKSGVAHLKATIAKRGRRLKTKTLYVLDELIDKKLTVDEFTELYGYRVEVVDYEDWSQIVLNRQEEAAYSIVSPTPMGGNHVYAHYLMDAASGTILGVAYPKVAVALGPINLSKGNSATINEKMAEMYHEAVTVR